jgi:hypothetical protein
MACVLHSEAIWHVWVPGPRKSILRVTGRQFRKGWDISKMLEPTVYHPFIDINSLKNNNVTSIFRRVGLSPSDVYYEN